MRLPTTSAPATPGSRPADKVQRSQNNINTPEKDKAMRNWLALAIVASLSVLILGCGGTSAQPARESAPDSGEAAASPTSAAPTTSPDSAAAAPTSLQSAPTRSAKSGAISSATATPESKLSITLPGAITGLLPGQQSITTPTPASRAGSGSEKISQLCNLGEHSYIRKNQQKHHGRIGGQSATTHPMGIPGCN